jgi:hypothetical protein
MAEAHVYFVLAVPPPTHLDAAARVMAERLGGHAIDQRQVLLKGVPWIVTWREDLADAQAFAQELSAAGLEAHAWHEKALEAVPVPLEARAFRVADGILEVTDRRETLRIAAKDVLLVLRARTEHETETRTETTQKKTNLAALAMGLPISSSKVTQDRQRDQERAFFVLVYTATAAVRLSQLGLDFTGLGTAMQPTATGNYQALLAMLTGLCPHATFDSRLERMAGRLATMPGEVRNTTNKPDRKTTVRAATTAHDNGTAATGWRQARVDRQGLRRHQLCRSRSARRSL